MLFAIAVILILIADQGLKYWVTLSIPLDEGVRALLPGVLELRNIHNNGAAFSLLSGAPRWIFIILALVFTVIIIVAVRREWVRGAFGRWMAILLLAGALGNCLDRMLSGYVVDMLAFQFWPSFPVFNLADVCIVIGAIGFFLHILLYKEPAAEEAPEEKKSARREKTASVRPAAETVRVRERKSAEEKPVQTASPEEPTQRVVMKPKSDAPKAPKKPAAAKPAVPPRPAQTPQPKSESDPFAAWDKAVKELDREAKAKAEAAKRPEPVPEPKPSDVKPTVQRPKPADDAFSLEDILAEFKD